jgi:hypothetical protein
MLPRMLIACFLLNALLRLAPSDWRPTDTGEAGVRQWVFGEGHVRNMRAGMSVATTSATRASEKPGSCSWPSMLSVDR